MPEWIPSGIPNDSAMCVFNKPCALLIPGDPEPQTSIESSTGKQFLMKGMPTQTTDLLGVLPEALHLLHGPRSYSLISESLEPVSRKFPLMLHLTLVTALLCACMLQSSLEDLGSHSFTRESLLPVAISDL